MELTPEIIKNIDFEGFVINKVNNQKMIDNPEMRFERLRLVSQHNILLAAKCIIHCFLPQEREKRFILGLAEELVKDYDNLEESASAFVAISRLGDMGLLFEQYNRLKTISNKIKKNLIPHYLKFLKYNVAEQEQSILFSMLINLSTSYEEAVEIFHAMELQHILPTIYAYNGVINKANDWEETQFWLIRAANEGLKPNIITYGILMRLSKDFNTAWELKKEMNSKNMKADSQIYELLLRKATKKDDIEILAHDSLNNKFYKTGFYEKIISRISGYDTSFSFLEELKRKKIFSKLNKEEIYNSLSNKINNYDQASSLSKEMKINNITPTDKIFKNLASNIKDYEGAILLLDKMKEYKIKAGGRTFSCLLFNIVNYDEVHLLLEQIKLYDVVMDNKMFQILLKRERSYAESISLLNCCC